jgi:hypothetical protein
MFRENSEDAEIAEVLWKPLGLAIAGREVGDRSNQLIGQLGDENLSFLGPSLGVGQVGLVSGPHLG